MKLVLMVGGKGTRLYPLTKEVPKPMLPLNGKPVLEHIINWARKQGITDVIICSHYLSHVIEEHFGNGSKFGVKISYSVEKEPLGTGGPLNLIKDKLNEDFIIQYGDIISDINLKKLVDFHLKNKSDTTIVVQNGSHPEESDLVELENDGRVKKFWLRPHDKNTQGIKLTNAAIYMFSPRILEELPEGIFSIERELLIKLIESGKRVYGYYTEEYIEDMGNIDRMKQVEERLKKSA